MNSICINIRNLKHTVRPKQLGVQISETSMHVFRGIMRPSRSVLRDEILLPVEEYMLELVPGDRQ